MDNHMRTRLRAWPGAARLAALTEAAHTIMRCQDHLDDLHARETTMSVTDPLQGARIAADIAWMLRVQAGQVAASRLLRWWSGLDVRALQGEAAWYDKQATALKNGAGPVTTTQEKLQDAAAWAVLRALADNGVLVVSYAQARQIAAAATYATQTAPAGNTPVAGRRPDPHPDAAVGEVPQLTMVVADPACTYCAAPTGRLRAYITHMAGCAQAPPELRQAMQERLDDSTSDKIYAVMSLSEIITDAETLAQHCAGADEPVTLRVGEDVHRALRHCHLTLGRAHLIVDEQYPPGQWHLYDSDHILTRSGNLTADLAIPTSHDHAERTVR